MWFLQQNIHQFLDRYTCVLRLTLNKFVQQNPHTDRHVIHGDKITMMNQKTTIRTYSIICNLIIYYFDIVIMH